MVVHITRLDNSFYNETNTCDYFITMGDKTDETKKNNIRFVNFRLRNKRYFKQKEFDTLLILLNQVAIMLCRMMCIQRG